VLTDNEKTVTVDHVAGVPVRNQQMVAFASYYMLVVHTCVPADPASVRDRLGGGLRMVRAARVAES